MAWIIVGLGNPGEEYTNTRHNTGRMAVQYFAKKQELPAWKEDKKSNSLTAGATMGKTIVALVLPNTFMNKSGTAVAKFVKSMKAAESMVVVYDDLDLPVGKMKISFDRGSGGHKGIESIARAVKTKRFVRVRIGISPETSGGKLRKPSGEKEVNDFILGRFRDTDMKDLTHVFKEVAIAIECIIRDGREIAMNRFN
ncbi:aminoacyl-tRNA hydrolase [Candidatus Kaiserbacteria bacterium]|nr:aminoacyl-tRNA hydrolase [Candidatus Kaiserbacteria bacterium]